MSQAWRWEKVCAANSVTEWSLRGPTVLCRFWYDAPPDEDARTIAAAREMRIAIAKLICPSCNHELQHHADKDGCEIERGDGYRHAEFEEALGPCGCNDDDLQDDYPDFVRALEAFRQTKEQS